MRIHVASYIRDTRSLHRNQFVIRNVCNSHTIVCSIHSRIKSGKCGHSDPKSKLRTFIRSLLLRCIVSPTKTLPNERNNNPSKGRNARDVWMYLKSPCVSLVQKGLSDEHSSHSTTDPEVGCTGNPFFWSQGVSRSQGGGGGKTNQTQATFLSFSLAQLDTERIHITRLLMKKTLKRAR